MPSAEQSKRCEVGKISDSMERDLNFGIESKSLNASQTLLGHAAGGAVG